MRSPSPWAQGKVIAASLALLGMVALLPDTSASATGRHRRVIAHEHGQGHRRSSLPDGLRRVNGGRQLIIVTSASSSSSHARLVTYQQVDGRWVRKFPTMAARVGVNGWSLASSRREGDGTTPEGLFSLGPTIYGNARDPGVVFDYHQVVPGDYWDENPATGGGYNTFEHSTDTDCARNPFGGDTECLWLEKAPYPYFAVINFNTPARGAFGSGIFLHVTIGPTEGCVSVSQANLVKLLVWLNPVQRPRIVLAGTRRLSTL